MSYTYAGFLSYAHVDEAVAARLHRALETYKIPKSHNGSLSPIFRDANELTAHHSLPDKIRGAVTGSRVLIVLCSPAAKASHWVNEEIRLFREIHGEAAILCVLAEGTPETSFPPALIEDGQEPLAANLGGSKESFRLGVTQIAAAMLGVGLDTLIQRDTRRKRRRLQAVTAGALMFSGLMGATTFSAVTARDAAETNRMQAEDLVEYMITDLKEKLEPVGRLDILDSIGDRAVEYYDAQDISKLPDDSLARQARARHVLGQVALDARDMAKARQEVEAAARLTKEVYDRNPNNADAISSHAQSEYWKGEVYYKLDENKKALLHWQAYAKLGERLHSLDPDNYDWIMERGWGANNLATLSTRAGDYIGAKDRYIEAVEHFKNASDKAENNFQAQKELANSLGGLAQVSLGLDNIDEAISYRKRQSDLYNVLLERRPDDLVIRNKYAQVLSRLATEGLLNDNPKRLEDTIKKTCSEYEFLIQHDPNNRKWKSSYYLFLKTILADSREGEFEYDDIGELERRFTELLDEVTSW